MTITPGTTNSIGKSTLRIVFTNGFGDQTDITKDLRDASMESLYAAIREALAGCGFAAGTIDDWFPNE